MQNPGINGRDGREASKLAQVPEDLLSRHQHMTPPITAAELMNMELPPTRWVVPDVLPEGVTILAGKPKKGKSWMALGLCEAVAAGGVAFGIKDVQQGDTLYLALEDNQKRLKKRLQKVLDGRPAPERMHLHTQWPRVGEGGAEELDKWLTEHPDARLVVIDTLAKIRKPARGQHIYTEDYAALEPLLPLAAKHGVAIIVVYHLRKMAAADPMDEISSSTGLTAGVDGFMILRRTPGGKGPTLYVEGRDIEEPTDYALHWNTNTATWTIEGDAEEVRISKERADILLIVNRNHPVSMKPKEVSEVLGPHHNHNSTKKLMWTMAHDGQLVKDDDGGYLPANPTNPSNLGNRGNSGNHGNSGNLDSQGYLFDGAGNRNGNPGNSQKADTYGESNGRVTEVTAVTEVDEIRALNHSPDESNSSCDTSSGAGGFSWSGESLSEEELRELREYWGPNPNRDSWTNATEEDPALSEDTQAQVLNTGGGLTGGPIMDFLADPPQELLVEAEKCAHEGGIGSRLFKPLVSSVAYAVYGTAAGRCGEVRPAVEAWVRGLQEKG